LPALAEALAADAARLAPLVDETAGEKEGTVSPSAEEPREQFLSIGKLREQYLDYIESKVDEVEEQKTARRYYHGAQLSAEQLRVLRRRRQPPAVWNRTARKINQIVGLVERMRSDPKALPGNLKSESGADIAVHVIRSVLDANDFKGLDPWCLLESCIDGIAGVQRVLTQDAQKQKDLALVPVITDEFFYDPKSYMGDFSDARYKGVSKWVDLDDAIEMFPKREDDLRALIQGDTDLTSNPDREFKWVIISSNRIRLVEHWYRHRGKWCWCFYVANTKLDEGVSPFFDERGNSVDSFNMFSVAVDHDGDRYGFVRNLQGPQDSLNQSKSKQLHVANSRRIIADKGAVDNVETARIEAARADGLIEKNPGFELRFDDNPQDLAAFSAMAGEAAQEMDSYANLNVAALTGASITNISGRAVELLRQPGMAELGPFMLAIRKWKLDLFRAIWNDAQRHWTTPKWLRMIDDETKKPVFMQVNTLQMDQFGRPVIVNMLGELDVDIILEEGQDVASLMSELWETFKGYPPGTFPPQLLIEMWPGPRSEKARLLKLLQPPPPSPQQVAMQQAAMKLQFEGAAAKNAKTVADARFSDARAQKAISDIGQGNAQTQLDAAELQHRILSEALQTMQGQEGQPPVNGARKAPDGNWYLSHPSGRHFRVEARGQ